MPARGDGAKIVNVRRHQTPVGSNLAVVDPHRRLPVRTFERQHQAATYHVRQDLYVALIPGRTQIVTWWLRKKGDFRVTRLDVSFVIIPQVPEMIVEGEDPWCAGANLVAEVLRLKDSWQVDLTWQHSVEPLRLLSRISAIQREPPPATEIDGMSVGVLR